MIRAMVRLGNWLDRRFPEKLVVTAADYTRLHDEIGAVRVELDLLREEIHELKANHAATLDRVVHLEASSVHKGAVQELITVIKSTHDELVALKANLGWSKGIVEGPSDLAAMLNGEIVHGE